MGIALSCAWICKIALRVHPYLQHLANAVSSFQVTLSFAQQLPASQPPYRSNGRHGSRAGCELASSRALSSNHIL